MTPHPFDKLTLPHGSSLIFTPCPGTKGTSLSEAIQTLGDAGADAIVSMLSDAELAALSVPSLGTEASAAGFIWFQLPVEDDTEPCEPFQKAWEQEKDAILKLFNEGKSIAIHCRGGTGRTGMMAAIILLETGHQWSDVQAQIQAIRPKALTLSAHLDYLRKHYSI